MRYDVVFINDYHDDAIPYSVGLVTLATYLNKKGFHACVIDFSDLHILSNATIRFLGIGGWSGTFWRVVAMAKVLKEKFPHIPIIAGGGHLSSCPDAFEQHRKLFDYWVQGEGERAVVGILQGRYLPNKIIHEPIAEEDLVFPEKKYLGTPHGFHVSITSRGCSRKCGFCSIPCVTGNASKNLAPRELLRNIYLLVEGGVSTIYFADSNITNNKRWVKEFCETIYADRVRFSWSANCCLDGINEETLELLRKAGCVSLRIGIESGATDLLDAMGKQIRLDQAVRAVRLCKKKGINVHAYFLYGVLGETKETMKKTREFYDVLKPDTFYLSLYRPYPGTDMYRASAEKGYLNIHNWSTGHYAELEYTGALSQQELLEEKEKLWGELIRKEKRMLLKQQMMFGGRERARSFVVWKKFRRAIPCFRGLLPGRFYQGISFFIDRRISRELLQECLGSSSFLEDKRKLAEVCGDASAVVIT